MMDGVTFCQSIAVNCTLRRYCTIEKAYLQRREMLKMVKLP